MRELYKEIVRYKRRDGVDLTATLYLPVGYVQERDGPLPCIMWVYPEEFKSKVFLKSLFKVNRALGRSWTTTKVSS